MKTPLNSMNELLRPWKLASLAAGIGILCYGAVYVGAPDWDCTFSVIQALLTYVLAPWSLRVAYERRWPELPASVVAAWFTVDGAYMVYWTIVDPAALVMRDANFAASLPLYYICGMIWMWRGSMRELASLEHDRGNC